MKYGVYDGPISPLVGDLRSRVCENNERIKNYLYKI